jgi:hypothetical protein
MAQVLFWTQLSDDAKRWINKEQYTYVYITEYGIRPHQGVPEHRYSELRAWLIKYLKGEVIIYEDALGQFGDNRRVRLYFSDSEDASFFTLSEWGSYIIRKEFDK